ncbi:outer membrane protein assembly factor BamE [Novosphingobium lentum]|uniref:outer membrane protein assembly factor BamE n=1 Tax=Novosphingobium lentum TaxID=145287 RepID=UPI001FE00989|nr:outer membrane protein assembly factor BamE [Novosphingobium lentum]
MLRSGCALALVVLAGGCASIRDHRGYTVDSALVDSVQPGVDNRLSVERSLGRPTFASQFGTPTWYYVSLNSKQAPFTRPRTDAEFLLKVNFDQSGNVSSVTRGGMDKVVRLNPDGHKTPTLGRDRSFFEDLFGNIGAVGALPGSGGTQGGTTGPGRGPNGS